MSWKTKCPVCGAAVVFPGYSEAKIREVVKGPLGVDFDCPKCNALLQLHKDLTVTNLASDLSKIYAEEGLDVSEEQAKNSYVEF